MHIPLNIPLTLAMAVAASCALTMSTGYAAPVPEEGSAWSYEGEGADWGSLGFEKCEEGRSQSPLNLDGEESGSAVSQLESSAVVVEGGWSDLRAYNENPMPLNFTNLGHTLQLGPFPQRESSTEWETQLSRPQVTRYDGKNYTVLQIHFHTPSEHHVRNDFYPMEMHVVHKATGGEELMVVGVLMQVGSSASDFLARITPLIPQLAGNGTAVEARVVVPYLPMTQIPVEVNNFRSGFWTYGGSLTTPPCTEGVRWLVAKDPMTISAQQWDQFKDVMGYNARPTQQRS